MAISKKGSRGITVCDIPLRWKVSSNGKKHVVIFFDDGSGSNIIVYLNENDIVTPRIIRDFVEHAFNVKKWEYKSNNDDIVWSV